MRTIYGILLVGVSAFALGGCTTEEGGAALLANALLGSGALNEEGEATTLSNAATDAKTQVTATYNDEAEGFADDKITDLAIAGGGDVAGPRDYKVNTASELGDTRETGLFTDTADYKQFVIFEPDDPEGEEGPQSILVATADGNAFAGFVGANADSTGNIAAGYGVIVPVGATAPDEKVYYRGNVAATAQRVDDMASFISGQAEIAADFTNGSVTGGFNFDHTVPNRQWVEGVGSVPLTSFTDTLHNGNPLEENSLFVGFTGTMSTDKATYASTAVAVDGIPGSGNVIGGFAGTNYETTAGAIDVQSAQTWGGNPNPVKITGAYIGTSVE